MDSKLKRVLIGVLDALLSQASDRTSGEPARKQRSPRGGQGSIGPSRGVRALVAWGQARAVLADSVKRGFSVSFIDLAWPQLTADNSRRISTRFGLVIDHWGSSATPPQDSTISKRRNTSMPICRLI